MTYRSFRRVFTNNSKYRSYDKIPYFDSLAHTVEEVLYKRNFKGCDYCHYLGIIQLFDFMTLVAYFISASSEDFARATIKGYLTEMKHYKSGNQYDTQVEYTAEGDLLVTNAKEELITDLLWATHLYATFRFELDEDKEHWRNTMDMLYEIMMEESDWESELAKTDKDSYLEANKVALKIFQEHWQKNKEADGEEHKAEDVSQLQARNAELIQRQEAHQSEEPAEEIKWHDKVRLELLLRLLENGGTDMKGVVKVRVAEVMQCVTGLPISTCKNYCTNRDLRIKTHEEEILKLNSKLQAIGISIRL